MRFDTLFRFVLQGGVGWRKESKQR